MDALETTEDFENSLAGLNTYILQFWSITWIDLTDQPFKSYKGLEDYTKDEVDNQVYLNTRFTTQLTRLLLPDLARSRPSSIVNMSCAGCPFSV